MPPQNKQRIGQRNTTRRHAIRLHGPWKIEAAGPLCEGVPERFQAPAAWSEISLAPFSVLRTISRRFGRPTGITNSQTLELVILSLNAPCSVQLNDFEIGEATRVVSELRFDVTGRIKSRNELKLVFQNAALPDDPAPANNAAPRLGDVRLEILEPSDSRSPNGRRV